MSPVRLMAPRGSRSAPPLQLATSSVSPSLLDISATFSTLTSVFVTQFASTSGVTAVHTDTTPLIASRSSQLACSFTDMLNMDTPQTHSVKAPQTSFALETELHPGLASESTPRVETATEPESAPEIASAIAVPESKDVSRSSECRDSSSRDRSTVHLENDSFRDRGHVCLHSFSLRRLVLVLHAKEGECAYTRVRGSA